MTTHHYTLIMQFVRQCCKARIPRLRHRLAYILLRPTRAIPREDVGVVECGFKDGDKGSAKFDHLARLKPVT